MDAFEFRRSTDIESVDEILFLIKRLQGYFHRFFLCVFYAVLALESTCGLNPMW